MHKIMKSWSAEMSKRPVNVSCLYVCPVIDYELAVDRKDIWIEEPHLRN